MVECFAHRPFYYGTAHIILVPWAVLTKIAGNHYFVEQKFSLFFKRGSKHIFVLNVKYSFQNIHSGPGKT